MPVERDAKGRIKKGQVLNPKGRPRKNRGFTDKLREQGNLVDDKGVTQNTRLAEEMWRKALNGDLKAAQMIYDRCEGTPTQHIQKFEHIKVVYEKDWGSTPS